ncbi:sulfurtransferase TusA family protein [Ramlibacter montanisoli]|uniref:Sulfurtransferase TusA family protein n=1 Tax=Ramlibacter montanisoli TaxID=2732512 RepID=A0A849K9H3_9BURK|nr:sulfurtransferase TusA family protein [Ramlibacter montanisoli]NNU43084.1 sulfurtransferase TusA family protein [Ramlibacter montanisoli]
MAGPSSGEKDVLTDASGPAAFTDGELQELDARGISSPLQVLRAHRALRGMRAGQVLRVVTSSEQTLAEFQALSKYVVGYELVSQEQFGDEFIHVLRKKR